jgi:hypothetical protein
VRQCPARSGTFLGEAIRPAIRSVAEHADHERHPQRQDLIDLNARVGQHPINLFDRVPGIQAASHR